MKKVFTTVLLLLAAGMSFALDFFQFGDFIAGKDYILWEDYENRISRDNLYVGKDCWYHFNDRFIIFQSDGYERFTQASLFNFKYIQGSEVQLRYRTVNPYRDDKDELEFRDVPKVKFTASSCLSEDLNGKKRVYSPDGLSSYMTNCPEEYTYRFYDVEKTGIWDYSHLPWCEGAAGYGIGEKLTAEFEEPVYSFVILNGYVDPLHPDYYKKNSRVKTLKVTDTEHNKKYTFTVEDVVIEQRFCLDEPAAKLEFEIAEVYEGDEYKDTCITGLFGQTTPWYLSVCNGDSEYTNYDTIVLLQKELQNDFEGDDWGKESIVTNVSVKDVYSYYHNCVEYFVRRIDITMLYLMIIDSNKKNNYDRIDEVELYKDDVLRIFLQDRNDMDFDSKKPVKTIEYKISSSYPLFTDSETVAVDPNAIRKTVEFKGFYEYSDVFFHFMTGFSLKFNYEDGTSSTYVASESDLQKIKKHYDVSIEINWNH